MVVSLTHGRVIVVISSLPGHKLTKRHSAPFFQTNCNKKTKLILAIKSVELYFIWVIYANTILSRVRVFAVFYPKQTDAFLAKLSDSQFIREHWAMTLYNYCKCKISIDPLSNRDCSCFPISICGLIIPWILPQISFLCPIRTQGRGFSRLLSSVEECTTDRPNANKSIFCLEETTNGEAQKSSFRPVKHYQGKL